MKNRNTTLETVPTTDLKII